jgi:hypothetical protein
MVTLATCTLLWVPLDYKYEDGNYCVGVPGERTQVFMSSSRTVQNSPVIKHVWILSGGPGQGSVLLNFWNRENVIVHSLEFRRPTWNMNDFTESSLINKYISTSHGACDMLEAIKSVNLQYSESKNEHFIHGISYGTMWAERLRKFDTQNLTTAYILEGIIDSTKKDLSFEKLIGNHYPSLNIIKSCVRDDTCRNYLKATLDNESLDKIMEASALDKNALNDGTRLIDYKLTKNFISDEIVEPYIVQSIPKDNFCIQMVSQMFMEAEGFGIAARSVFKAQQLPKEQRDLRMCVFFLQSNLVKCPDPFKFYSHLQFFNTAMKKVAQRVQSGVVSETSVWTKMKVAPLPVIGFDMEPFSLGTDMHTGLYCSIIGIDMQPSNENTRKATMFMGKTFMEYQSRITKRCKSIVERIGITDLMNVNDNYPNRTQNMYLMQGFIDINTPHVFAKDFYETIKDRNETGGITFVEYINGGHNPLSTPLNLCQNDIADDILANSGTFSKSTMFCINDLNSLVLTFDIRDAKGSFNLYTMLGAGYLLFVKGVSFILALPLALYFKRFIIE